MKNIVIFLLLVLSTKAFCIEYNTYEMLKIIEYGVTRDKNDTSKLGVEFGQGYSGSYGPSIFFDDNKLVISDFHNNRFLWLNENFDVNKNIIFDVNTNVAGNTFRYYFDSDGINNLGLYILGYTPDTGISIFEKESEKIISRINFYRDFKFLTNFNSVFFHANVLYIHDKDGKLWSIKTPGLDQKKNKSNLLDEDATLALINKIDIQGLTIDDKKRIFLNGVLQTIDYAEFYKYYKEEYNSNGKMSIKLDTEVTSEASSGMTYVGTDFKGNYYWTLGRKHICIFTPKGLLVDLFKYNSKKSSTIPTVSPEGDIYFMHHAKDEVTLYKIKKQW